MAMPSGASNSGPRVAAALLVLVALTGSIRADEESPEARKALAAKVKLELERELKKAGFPACKESSLSDAKGMKKDFMPGLLPADAKLAADSCLWGNIFDFKKKKSSQRVLVTLLACRSAKSAQVLIEAMRRKIANVDWMMDGVGVEVLSKKQFELKLPNTTKAFAYERLIEQKPGPPLNTISLFVTSGRYLIEVHLEGSKKRGVSKHAVQVILVGLGLVKRVKKKK